MYTQITKSTFILEGTSPASLKKADSIGDFPNVKKLVKNA